MSFLSRCCLWVERHMFQQKKQKQRNNRNNTLFSEVKWYRRGYFVGYQRVLFGDGHR